MKGEARWIRLNVVAGNHQHQCTLMYIERLFFGELRPVTLCPCIDEVCGLLVWLDSLRTSLLQCIDAVVCPVSCCSSCASRVPHVPTLMRPACSHSMSLYWSRRLYPFIPLCYPASPRLPLPFPGPYPTPLPRGLPGSLCYVWWCSVWSSLCKGEAARVVHSPFSLYGILQRPTCAIVLRGGKVSFARLARIVS